MFERLRERIEAALAAATPAADPRARAGLMRQALIEMKAGIGAMREALATAQRQLAAERAQLATAERRRALADGIADAATVEVADKYIARHRERSAVLEQKVAAQQAELTLAEQDLAEMTTQFNDAVKHRTAEGADASLNRAWGELGASGVDRPEVDPGHEALRSRLDHAAREAEADARLEELKRRMGK